MTKKKEVVNEAGEYKQVFGEKPKKARKSRKTTKVTEESAKKVPEVTVESAEKQWKYNFQDAKTLDANAKVKKDIRFMVWLVIVFVALLIISLIAGLFRGDGSDTVSDGSDESGSSEVAPTEFDKNLYDVFVYKKEATCDAVSPECGMCKYRENGEWKDGTLEGEICYLPKSRNQVQNDQGGTK